MSKYTAFEKAILGVKTDKEVEECHKKREQSFIDARRPKKFLLLRPPGMTYDTHITIFRDDDARKIWKEQYDHCEYKGEQNYHIEAGKVVLEV